MNESGDTTKSVNLSNKTYDNLKALVQFYIPAIAALLSGAMALYGFGNPETVSGGALLILTFLGGLLKASNRTYSPPPLPPPILPVVSGTDSPVVGGLEVVQVDANKTSVLISLDGDPYKFDAFDTVTFRVDKPSTSLEPLDTSN